MMSYNSSNSSVPVTFGGNPESVPNVLEAANKALKNINSLYNEIMTPKSDSDLSERDYSLESCPKVASEFKNNCANTNIKRPYTHSGLCNSCRTYISFCDSCHARNLNTSSKEAERIILNNLEQNKEFKNRLHRKINDTNARFKVTIPQPFSLTEENIKRQEAKNIKIFKMKEKLLKEEEKELKVKINSKPVPKHVSRPLYEEMVERNEKRKQERKEKCCEFLEKNTKPFNLTTKSKSITDLTKASQKHFQAKPLPKSFLSENITKKLQNKEEIRKILIAHRAEEMLKSSSLPFSSKNISKSHSSINLNECGKKKVDKPKPDIDAITKRLYTIQCKETLENWNNKVLNNKQENHKTLDVQPNRCIEKSNYLCKPKIVPNISLPFYNFPVRMSTAAALREKRIRDEIDLRISRDSRNETIKQQLFRKREEIMKNIWPRLRAAESISNSGKEIEEKVKSFRASQKIREQEYEKEIDDMMKRVSKQFLLIERQSKGKDQNLHNIVNEIEGKSPHFISTSTHSIDGSVADESKTEKSEDSLSIDGSVADDSTSEKAEDSEKSFDKDDSERSISSHSGSKKSDA